MVRFTGCSWLRNQSSIAGASFEFPFDIVLLELPADMFDFEGSELFVVLGLAMWNVPFFQRYCMCILRTDWLQQDII